jgi:hypothetical protein
LKANHLHEAQEPLHFVGPAARDERQVVGIADSGLTRGIEVDDEDGQIASRCEYETCDMRGTTYVLGCSPASRLGRCCCVEVLFSGRGMIRCRLVRAFWIDAGLSMLLIGKWDPLHL